MSIIYLDNFEPMEEEIMMAMLDLAEIKKGDKHIELGSGNGQFVVEATKRGANSLGYEIDRKLARESSRKNGINIITKSVYEVDVSKADILTFWFTKLPETEILIAKLHKEMKRGARLVASPGQAQYKWIPSTIKIIKGYKICLFIK